MNQGQHKSITRITALFMVAAMSLLIVNKALFTHIHITKDGQVITHSHPFKSETSENSGSTHQHTTQQFNFFDHLGLFFPILFLFISLVLFRYEKKYATKQELYFPQCNIALRYGRAPPVQ